MNVRFPLRLMVPMYVIVAIICIILAKGGSKAVTAMVENSPVDGMTQIVIDAGHGGIDGGAVSYSGRPESEINLQIANRTNDLMRLLGYRTIMLRSEDTSLHTEGNTIARQKISDLKNRVAIVNNTDHALLISIHQNAFPDQRYSGAQVFYSKNNTAQELAAHMQASFIRTVNPKSNRKPKAAKGIYLMEHSECPAILIECGFLSNPEEEAKLCDAIYQKKISAIIACTTSVFLGNQQSRPPAEPVACTGPIRAYTSRTLRCIEHLSLARIAPPLLK